MARKLEDIFNECYERILQGESFESCLRRYPEHAAELEPLLRTALGFTLRASSVQPRPEFKYWARARLEGAQTYARQQKRAAKPGLFSWQQGWAVVITAILVVLLAGGGTVAASSDALPDQPLYPVKLATEEVRLAFAVSDQRKAEVHARLAETRAAEIETMAQQGKTEQVATTAERLVNQLEQANAAIAKVESTTAGAAPFVATPEKIAPPGPPPSPPVADAPPPPPVAVAAPAAAATPKTSGTVKIAPPGPPPSPPVPDAPAPPSMPPPPPPAATTQKTAVTAKTEPIRESLEGSASKSLTAIDSALQKAPEQAKPALQHAIDKISEKSSVEAPKGPNRPIEGNQPAPKNQPKDKDKDKTESVPAKPESSQSSSQGGGTTESSTSPTPVTAQPTQPSTQSGGKTDNKSNPNSANTSQSQPSSQTPGNSSQNTGTKK